MDLPLDCRYKPVSLAPFLVAVDTQIHVREVTNIAVGVLCLNGLYYELPSLIMT